MQLFIETIKGHRLAIDVHIGDTVYKIKSYISDAMFISQRDQVLIGSNGLVLRDNECINYGHKETTWLLMLIIADDFIVYRDDWSLTPTSAN